METEQMDLNEISRMRIKETRKEHSMTLEQVAKLCGVQKSTVRKWEEGLIATIKYDHMKKMSEIFNVSLAWLMGMNVPMQNETSEHKVLRNKITDDLLFMSMDDLRKLKVLIDTMFIR